MYKCLNGLGKYDMNVITQQEQHDYNTRTKLNFSSQTSELFKKIGVINPEISDHYLTYGLIIRYPNIAIKSGTFELQRPWIMINLTRSSSLHLGE